MMEIQKVWPQSWTKIEKFSCCDLTIFFSAFFEIFSVHVLLYKSSLDYNSLFKLFESFKKSNFKTLKKFQISIVIQIGSIKQNVDRKNSKKFWDKKIVKMKLLIFKIITVQGSNFSIFCPNGPKNDNEINSLGRMKNL